MNPLLLFALTLVAPPEPPPVHLLAVGGGTTSPEITRKALEMAGGPAKARMLIVPQASGVADAGDRSAEYWREAGAKNVKVLDLSDKEKAVAAVKAADLIWMPGGDQNRLIKVLAGTGVPDAIRARMREGATVGGTSAGAAVLSGVMLTGEAELTAIKSGATITGRGLDLWPGVIVDQHFIKRQRFNRLLSAVLDKPDLIGIGIDESTAVAVVGTKCEVIGESQVIVIDARKAKVAKTGAAQRSAAVGVVVSIYTSGMTFELPAR